MGPGFDVAGGAGVDGREAIGLDVAGHDDFLGALLEDGLLDRDGRGGGGVGVLGEDGAGVLAVEDAEDAEDDGDDQQQDDGRENGGGGDLGRRRGVDALGCVMVES